VAPIPGDPAHPRAFARATAHWGGSRPALVRDPHGNRGSAARARRRNDLGVRDARPDRPIAWLVTSGVVLVALAGGVVVVLAVLGAIDALSRSALCRRRVWGSSSQRGADQRELRRAAG